MWVGEEGREREGGQRKHVMDSLINRQQCTPVNSNYSPGVINWYKLSVSDSPQVYISMQPSYNLLHCVHDNNLIVVDYTNNHPHHIS